ncbi:hypothetical protein NC652_002690 [Populus alba x Populus x berolinensis]|nr:hypothetical protein NC652_002690 [Populus alba x Populus x berolinensis]
MLGLEWTSRTWSCKAKSDDEHEMARNKGSTCRTAIFHKTIPEHRGSSQVPRNHKN